MNHYKIVNKEHGIFVIGIALIVSVISAPLLGATSFTDVSKVAGVEHKAPSFGVSWGDFNDDGWPDIWVGNHYEKPSLFLNQKDGTFKNIIDEVWEGNAKSDAHGSAWADFDNDGDQDLIETAGGGRGVGGGPNHLYINDKEMLQNKAMELAVDLPLARGRTPLWVDVDFDGLLDLVLMNGTRSDGKAPSTLFHQGKNQFISSNDEFGFHDPGRTTLDKLNDWFKSVKHFNFGLPPLLHGNFRMALLSDLSGDGVMDLIGFSPMRIYSIHQKPFKDITYDFKFPTIKSIQDVVISDFNGDATMDFYLVRSKATSDIVKVKNEIHAQFLKNKSSPIPFVKFRAEGLVKFLIGPYTVEPEQILIGGEKNTSGNLELSLYPDDARVTSESVGYSSTKIIIEYDEKSKVWLYKSLDKLTRVIIASSETIELVDYDGIEDDTGSLPDKLLLNNNMKFISKSMGREADLPNACNSVVAEDFDNDMDVDVYLVCSRPSGNLPNIYMDNQGDGSFNLIKNAGGAKGDRSGRGESVATADFDRDGFIDLFVTNGAGTIPFANQGKHQLFRNNGNDNNWIEFNLRGVKSNSDGIGARVTIKSGGKTQVREQSGGLHRSAQNFKRLHFGLSNNKYIDEVIIQWPSGLEQHIYKISANKIITLTEGEDIR